MMVTQLATGGDCEMGGFWKGEFWGQTPNSAKRKLDARKSVWRNSESVPKIPPHFAIPRAPNCVIVSL